MTKRLRINIDFDDHIIKKNRYLNTIPIVDNICISDKLINYGSFGLLFNAFYNNEIVIAKVLKRKIPDHHLYSLTKIYNSDFDNILKPICISSCRKIILFPLIKGETLNYTIYNKISDQEKNVINNKMLECIHNLHSLNIIHSDIKPGNFMLFKDKVILIDIDGCIPIIDNKPIIQYLYPQYGTLGFRKPVNNRINFSDDLWSLGATIYNLNTNKVPYEDELENTEVMNESVLIYSLQNRYFENNRKVKLDEFKKNNEIFELLNLLLN